MKGQPAVGPEDFHERLRALTRIRSVNFYGMAEQVGAIFASGTISATSGSRSSDVVIRGGHAGPIPDAVGLIQV